MSRPDKSLKVSRPSLVTNGLLRFDGTGLSCPAKNTPTLDAEGNLTINGRLNQRSSSVKVTDRHSHQMLPDYTLVLVDSSKGDVTLTLPAVHEAQLNTEYTIKDSGGRAAACPIVVQTASQRDMIQTGHSFKITRDYGMVKLLSDGSQWLIMSEVTQLRPWRVRFV